MQDGSSKQDGVLLCSLAELKLRFLCPGDLPEVNIALGIAVVMIILVMPIVKGNLQ